MQISLTCKGGDPNIWNTCMWNVHILMCETCKHTLHIQISLTVQISLMSGGREHAGPKMWTMQKQPPHADFTYVWISFTCGVWYIWTVSFLVIFFWKVEGTVYIHITSEISPMCRTHSHVDISYVWRWGSRVQQYSSEPPN